MSAGAVSVIGPEEYLVRDRAAEVRSEYFEGRMYAMSGGTRDHARISRNIVLELDQGLRGTECEVLTSDVRLYISASGFYTYPDAVVFCGKPTPAGDNDDVFLNPTVVVEVLSHSTEAYDRGFKFAQYRKLVTLQEYVLCSQLEPRVEIFRRQADGEFKLSEYVGLGGECYFASIRCGVAMTKIYRDVSFLP